MPSGFVISLIILAVLSASLLFILQAEGGIDQLLPLIEKGWLIFQANSN